MRQALLLLVTVLGLPAPALAQQVEAVPVCCHSCGGVRYHHSACQTAQKGPAIAESLAQPAAGQYVAPPANGPVFGESNATGIDGPAIHFPALSLKLPTLQLPSLFRIRHNPRMMMNPSEAPYMQGAQQSPPLQLMMMPAAPAGSPPAQAPLDSPTQQAPAQKSDKDFHGVSTTGLEMLQASLQQRDQQIDRLERQLSRLQSALETMQQQPPGGLSREGLDRPVNSRSESRDRLPPPDRIASPPSTRRYEEPQTLEIRATYLQRLPAAP